jgi:hypothetical protein
MKPFLFVLLCWFSNISIAQGVGNANSYYFSMYSTLGSPYKTFICNSDSGSFEGVGNADDSILVDCLYRELGKFSENRIIAVGDNWKKGVIDFHGDTILPLIYDDISPYGFPRVAKLGDEKFVLRTDGTKGNPTSYSDINNYSRYVHIPNLIRFKRNGNVGYMNWECEEVIPPIYTNGNDFHNGLAAVKMDSLWGYINEQGDTIIEPQFVDANPFYSRGNLALVANKDSLYGFINQSGEVAIEFQYDKPTEYNEMGFHRRYWSGNAVVQKNGLKGIITESGEVVIPTEYTSFHQIMFREGWGQNIIAHQGDKCGVFSMTGDARVPIECEAIEWNFYKWSGRTATHLYYLTRDGGVVVKEL